MEITIFMIPILALLKSTIERVFFARHSAKVHLEAIERFGVKGVILRRPLGYLSFASFIASYWFMGAGVFWSIFAIIILSGMILFLLLPAPTLTIPEVGSEEYAKLISKRKRQGIIGVPIIVAWVLSWLFT